MKPGIIIGKLAQLDPVMHSRRPLARMCLLAVGLLGTLPALASLTPEPDLEEPAPAPIGLLDPDRGQQFRDALLAYTEDLAARLDRMRSRVAALKSTEDLGTGTDDSNAILTIWNDLDRIDRAGIMSRHPAGARLLNRDLERGQSDDPDALLRRPWGRGTESSDRESGRTGDREAGRDPVQPPALTIDADRVRAFIDSHIGDEVPAAFREMLSDDRTIVRLMSGRRGRDLQELMDIVEQDPELGEFKLVEFRSIVRVMHIMRTIRSVQLESQRTPSDDSGARLTSLKAQLAEAISARFEAQASMRRLELSRLRAQAASIETDLESNEANRESIVNRLVTNHMDMLSRPMRGPGRDRNGP